MGVTVLASNGMRQAGGTRVASGSLPRAPQLRLAQVGAIAMPSAGCEHSSCTSVTTSVPTLRALINPIFLCLPATRTEARVRPHVWTPVTVLASNGMRQAGGARVASGSLPRAPRLRLAQVGAI